MHPETTPSPAGVWEEWLSRSLDTLSSRALLRTLRHIQVASAGASSPHEAPPPPSRTHSLNTGLASPQRALLNASPDTDRAQFAGPSDSPRLESTTCGASADAARGVGARDALPLPSNVPSEVAACDADAVRVVVPAPVFQQWLDEHQEPAGHTPGTPDPVPLPDQVPECSGTAASGASWAGPMAPLEPPGTPGVPLTLFSGNDYLGLASHPRVRRAAAQVGVMAASTWPPLISCFLFCLGTDRTEALLRSPGIG